MLIPISLLTIFAKENLSLFLQSQSLQLALWVELIDIVVSGLSIVNLLYICRKHNIAALKASLLGLSQYIEIIDLPSTFVIDGLKSDWLDYEDFLQHETAIASNCDCIITRNSDDFTMSRLPVYNASDFMFSLCDVR